MAYVRVRDKDTGHHLSILQQQYDANPDLWQVLKQPAETRSGDPLPPKFHTQSTADDKPAEKKAAKTATSEKETD